MTARGFSLLELVAVIAVLSLLTLGVAPGLVGMLEFTQRMTTQARLEQWRSILEQCIDNHLYEVYAGPPGTVTIEGRIYAGSGIAAGGSVEEAWHLFDRCGGPPFALTASDGFNRPWLFFVSADLAGLPDVAGSFHRTIALLSTGSNGRLESQFDPVTGRLMVGGDDLVESLGGLVALRRLQTDARRKLDRVAAAWHAYAQTRYLASKARAWQVDYFAATDASGNAAAPLWDGVSPDSDGPGGLIASTGSGTLEATLPQLGLLTALGLAPDDVTLLSGVVLRVDNASDAVNNPDNSSPARSLPPFTARVLAPMPGGGALVATVIGAFE